MKKSEVVKVFLLSGACVSLAWCDQQSGTDARFFKDAAECTQAYDETTCRQAVADGDRDALATAPRFATREECEQQFGPENCESVGSGVGSYFAPALLGYLIGRSFRRPVFRGPDGGAMLLTGSRNAPRRIGTLYGSGSSTTFQADRRSRPVRGGFGTRGWGGGG